MKKTITMMISFLFLFLPTALFAWQWIDLWQTADQQGAKLLQKGKAGEASHVFKNKSWQGVAFYRAQNYKEALQQFNRQKNSDGHYNAGNAYANLGQYQAAIEAYDKAIALNPNNSDAIFNREIIKKLLDKKNQQKQSSKSCSSPQPKNEKNQTENKSDSKSKSCSSPQTKNEKKDTENKSSNNQKTREQNQTQQNSSKNSKPETKALRQNQQTNSNQSTNHEQQANNSHQLNNQSIGSQEKKAFDSKIEKAPLATEEGQTKEDQKQLLRRLPDDSGGLLRQKFLRDYLHRHANDAGEGEK